MADVPLLEDWMFAWSVDRFVETGQIEVLAITGPHSVFETLWGALFVFPFGSGFGVLRVSTLVLSAISGIALWELLSDLAVGSRLRALGVAAYLFNPLSMSLSYSFMSDPHATALLVIALALYVRGLTRQRIGLLWLGSMVAALGYLSRPQVVVVTVAGALVALAYRERRWIHAVAAISLLPAATAGLYWLWRRGGSATLNATATELVGATFGEIAGSFLFSLVIGLTYVGLFVAPVALLVPGKLAHLAKRTAVAAATLVTTFLVVVGRHIPVSGDWLTSTGIGPATIANYVPPLGFTVGWVLWVLTVFYVLGLAVGVGLVAHRFRGLLRSKPAVLVLAAAVAWGAGVVPAAFFFRLAPPDRYYLPLLPLLIALILWALNSHYVKLHLSWIAVGLCAAVSVVVVQQTLAAEQAVWALAERTVESGVPMVELSAGAAWDGFHFGPAASEDELSDLQFLDREPPWWLALMAPQIDPKYVISLTSPEDLRAIDSEDYRSLLLGGSGTVYLVPLE